MGVLNPDSRGHAEAWDNLRRLRHGEEDCEPFILNSTRRLTNPWESLKRNEKHGDKNCRRGSLGKRPLGGGGYLRGFLNNKNLFPKDPLTRRGMGQNQRWPKFGQSGYITPALLGIPTQGDKIRNGYLTLAFSGAHMQVDDYITRAFLGVPNTNIGTKMAHGLHIVYLGV